MGILGLGIKAAKTVFKASAGGNKLKETLSNNATAMQSAQIANNIADAKSGNLFQAGWRPALAWSIVILIMFNYLFIPMMQIFAGKIYPTVDIPDRLWDMMTLMLGGLVGARTYEKVANKKIVAKAVAEQPAPTTPPEPTKPKRYRKAEFTAEDLR